MAKVVLVMEDNIFTNSVRVSMECEPILKEGDEPTEAQIMGALVAGFLTKIAAFNSEK